MCNCSTAPNPNAWRDQSATTDTTPKHCWGVFLTLKHIHAGLSQIHYYLVSKAFVRSCQVNKLESYVVHLLKFKKIRFIQIPTNVSNILVGFITI